MTESKLVLSLVIELGK